MSTYIVEALVTGKSILWDRSGKWKGSYKDGL